MNDALTDSGLRTLLHRAFSLMGAEDPAMSGPKALDRMLQLATMADESEHVSNVVQKVRESMLSEDPNNPVRGLFGQMLRAWDFARQPMWAKQTAPNTISRRRLIYDMLKLSEVEISLAERHTPYADLRNSNIVIAEDHEDWYRGARRSAGFYWTAYRNHLRDSAWSEESLGDLDEASNLVMERISDPLRTGIWATRGLVVGYVQSGKTANFTAVVAKAADAGYRLIVVLAGTLDVLRSQTQRRIDKELIGKELIYAGVRDGEVHEYAADTDWEKFIEHGGRPSSRGFFDIQRLTGFRDDYKSLGRGTAALEFLGPHHDRPYNHADNLRHSPARIMVMKKNPSRLRALIGDIKALQHTGLAQIPALVIDDESDQASVNTTKPAQSGNVRERTATNREIVRLLKLLPRAQYVGYTATPFANVFIDPTDSEDLFPRDFLIGLRRPPDYMGVRNFFDLDADGEPLDGDDRPPGYESNERAFLRDVRAMDGEDDEAKDRRGLAKALDSFLITGAMKLYRKGEGVRVDVKHHTMLVHRSTATSEHTKDRDLVLELFEQGGYETNAAVARLKKLWEDDFLPVCKVRSNGLPFPDDFEKLLPFVREALRKIRAVGSPFGPVRLVNAEPGNEEHAPDFDREQVWSILVGGAKLSRGFTIEGLTVSYFRRRIRTADTLIQTGRWFGFRRGYQDLVRVYLGRDEPDGSGTFDLLEAFKAICQDEESFRAQLRRYQQTDGKLPVKPMHVPPLVAQHLLQPAATNKMYNAVIKYQNFGGEFKEQTRLPSTRAKIEHNARLVRTLLDRTEMRLLELGAGAAPGRPQKMYVAELQKEAVLEWLQKMEWAERARGYVLEREFIEGTGKRDPGIQRWLLVAPQVKEDVAYWQCQQPIKVVKRTRVDSSRFKVFSEPRHRTVAKAISGVEQPWMTEQTRELIKDGTAVILFYAVVEEVPPQARAMADHEVTVGTALFFPSNEIKEPIIFGVNDPDRPNAIVVPRQAS